MLTGRMALLGAASLALLAPGVANATSREDARVAIAAAEAKIDAGDRAGVNGPASDAQSRARDALEDAQDQYDKGHEGRAFDAAKRASSLADLALATAQARAADADKAVAATEPQVPSTPVPPQEQ